MIVCFPLITISSVIIIRVKEMCFQRIYMPSYNSMTATTQKQKHDTRWSDICPTYFCTWCFLLACVAVQHCTVQQKTLEKEASLIVSKLFWKFGSDQASLQKHMPKCVKSHHQALVHNKQRHTHNIMFHWRLL